MRPPFAFHAIPVAITILLAGACTALAGPEEGPESAIRDLLESSVEAWNVGDIEGFMATYWNNPGLRFASGNSVERGWQATLERYKRRYGEDRTSMGRLAFGDLEITIVAPDAAVVFGRYHLERADGVSEGLFTLTVRRMDGRWLIVQDHTSSAAD